MEEVTRSGINGDQTNEEQVTPAIMLSVGERRFSQSIPSP